MDSQLKPYFETQESDLLIGFNEINNLELREKVSKMLVNFKESFKVSHSKDPKEVLKSIVSQEIKLTTGAPGLLSFLAILIVGTVLLENKIIGPLQFLDILTIPAVFAFPSWVVIVLGVLTNRNTNRDKFKSSVIEALKLSSLDMDNFSELEKYLFKLSSIIQSQINLNERPSKE